MKRRAFVEHVGWTGTGIVFSLTAAGTFAARPAAGAEATGFNFVQISDSHIGFDKPANDDVAGTLTKAVDAINALPQQPAFVMHTGDVTHLSKPAQFDAAKNILGSLRAPLFSIPGEHDFLGSDGGAAYFAAFGKRGPGGGWYSFETNGVHFVSLVNVFNFETMGLLGSAQLAWLASDLAPLRPATPIVVFGHVPLYALYPAWGWTTEDGAQALALLRRFERVTVLNGHIHQVIEHQDGAIRFMTAAATAYPQPAPGTADQPGPLVVPKDQLLGVLGYRTVEYVGAPGPLAIAQHPLG